MRSRRPVVSADELDVALAAERALDDRLIAALRSELAAERALANRLADALRATKSSNRSWSDRLADVALSAFKEARRER
jgi:hypothetical protein